mgnify:CR=1 FL=1
MNKDYPMQTVDREDAPILGSVLPFPKEGEKNPKMDGFPLQTTIEGEEDSPFSDAIFDGIYYIVLVLFYMALASALVQGFSFLVRKLLGG